MKFLIALLFVPLMLAQAAPDAFPQYFVAAGGGYTRNAKPNAGEGWLSGAFQIGGRDSSFYSITTIDMTATTSTIRTGFAKFFAKSGNTYLLGRMDAGVSTVVPVIGSFTGGALLLYDLGGRYKSMTGMFLVGEVRVSAVSTPTTALPNQVTPGFYFGIGKKF